MLASIPASMVNHKPTDLGIQIHLSLTSSRFSVLQIDQDRHAWDQFRGADMLPSQDPCQDCPVANRGLGAT